MNPTLHNKIVSFIWSIICKSDMMISFNNYFYKHKPLRSLEEVAADIFKLEADTEGLLKKLVSCGERR